MYLFLYIHIYMILYVHIADANSPIIFFGCHSQVHASVRAAHNMRSWKLYWHYLTLTCRISQLSQGDRWSLPVGQGDGSCYDDLLIFLLEECNNRKSHFCHESTPDAEHDIWLHVTIFWKSHLKRSPGQGFTPVIPFPFWRSKISKKTPKNDPTKCPPKKISGLVP